MASENKLHNSYEHSGINYTQLDAVKREAQALALRTTENILDKGFKFVVDSLGESAALIETPDHYLAMTQEGLGTKNLVADAMEALTGNNYYHAIGIDAVATIANDLITTGASPLLIMQYFATGNEAWFSNGERTHAFLSGFKEGCDQVGAVWGGGETPTLPGMISPDTAIFAGSGLGVIVPKSRHLHGAKIRPGDNILGIESSGIHANGLSLARKLAEDLEDGYLSRLSDGRSFGEALLEPTLLYPSLLRAIFDANLDPHYAVNITGHGWLKLMRASEPFAYEIESIPPIPALFQFMMERLSLSPSEAYATLNMGLGFVLFLPPSEADRAIEIAAKQNLKAFILGTISPAAQSRIEIAPLSLNYSHADLGVRR